MIDLKYFRRTGCYRLMTDTMNNGGKKQCFRLKGSISSSNLGSVYIFLYFYFKERKTFSIMILKQNKLNLVFIIDSYF